MSEQQQYDCFISFKKTNAAGTITIDAELARMVYDYLTERGLCVFFSEVTLANLGAANYTDAIDKALDSTNIVVAVGTSRENLESKWVQYEWSSFANDIRGGKNGQILTYFDGMRPSDLPRALRNYQAFQHTSDSPDALEALYTFMHNALETMKTSGKVKDGPAIRPRPTTPRSSHIPKTDSHTPHSPRTSRKWPLLLLMLVAVMGIAGFMYYQSTATVEQAILTEDGVTDLVDAQIDAWNDKDVAAYVSCYDAKFRGMVISHDGSSRKYTSMAWTDEFAASGRDLHLASLETGEYVITLIDEAHASVRVPSTFTADEFTEHGETSMDVKFVNGFPKIVSETYTARERIVIEAERELMIWELLTPSERLLTEEDLEHLPQEQLRWLRGYIFAQHGFIFEDAELREFFSAFDWYQPTRDDVDDYLSEIEEDNIDLIEDYLD